SHLIEKNPAKAKQFNDTLADVYRYILQNKGRNLVLLREEIAFLQNYFDLLKIRFENALQFINTVDDSFYDTVLIPPISLQTLMENAVKHNEFSDASPLLIEMKIENDMLQFKNTLRKKKLRKISSRIGLTNLNERYKLTTEKEIQYTEKENVFVVQLPILHTIS
ncbi:MAG: histidine kinase, partial [Fimbriimonadaceae bacterium]|nr:histidine kinase [Chitinophagales bacterium]